MTDTSPAAELRAAAEKIHAIASGATPGVWHVTKWQQDVCDFEAGIGTTPGDHDVIGHGYEGGGVAKLADAAYIAAMHPGVGAVLADWLEAEGSSPISDLHAQRCRERGCPINVALAIARLINGSQR